MKARDIVGRKVVRIEQTRIETNTGWEYDLTGIVLDNGTRIGLRVHETPEGADYVIKATAYKHPKERTRP